MDERLPPKLVESSGVDIFFFGSKGNVFVDCKLARVDTSSDVTVLSRYMNEDELLIGKSKGGDMDGDTRTLVTYLRLSQHMDSSTRFCIEILDPQFVGVINAHIMMSSIARRRKNISKKKMNIYHPNLWSDARICVFPSEDANESCLLDDMSLGIFDGFDIISSLSNVSNIGAQSPSAQKNIRDLVQLSNKAFFTYAEQPDTVAKTVNMTVTVPAYCAGHVSVPTLLDPLIAKSVQMPALPSIVDGLIRGGVDQDTFNVPVPHIFVGKRFEDIYRFFSSKGILTLALYCNPSGAELPILWTSPPLYHIAEKSDSIIVYSSPYILYVVLLACHIVVSDEFSQASSNSRSPPGNVDSDAWPGRKTIRTLSSYFSDDGKNVSDPAVTTWDASIVDISRVIDFWADCASDLATHTSASAKEGEKRREWNGVHCDDSSFSSFDDTLVGDAASKEGNLAAESTPTKENAGSVLA